MGKEDKDGGGVGVVWDDDVLHVEKMCNELSQVEDLAGYRNKKSNYSEISREKYLEKLL